MAIRELEPIIRSLQAGELPVDFNWNRDNFPDIKVLGTITVEPTAEQVSRVSLVDEGLRDGLHGVESQPTVEEKIGYIGQLKKFGIDWATVGIFSGFGNKIDSNTKELLREMKVQYPDVTPVVLTLATSDALQWTVECKQINPKLASIAFMGTAPSRLLVEGWEKNYILTKLDWLVGSLRAEEITVIGATEHTTQTPPDFLKQIVETEVRAGAEYFCIADTIGIARPVGTARIVSFVRKTLDEMGKSEVQIDWHGHRDTGNDIANAMVAVAAGAGRVHVVAGGIGERAGNTPLEVMVINLASILRESGGDIPWNLGQLSEVLESYYKLVKLQIPEHGAFGDRSFVTSLGIHTSAMDKAAELARKAEEMGDIQLSEDLKRMGRTVYSAIDPQTVGREHETRVSPWSGVSTVRRAAKELGIDPDKLTLEEFEFILDIAKKGGRELSSEELRRYLNNHH